MMVLRFGKYKLSALMLMVLVACIGCSNDDVDYVADSQQTTIAFSAYTNLATKSFQSDITTLSTFYVTAIGSETYYFKAKAFKRSSTKPYTWTTTTPFYWTHYPLTFYAYTKATTSIKNYSTEIKYATVKTGFDRATADQTLTVTVADSMDRQEDLVAAYAANATAPTDASTYALTFNHYLTQVTVQARCMNKNYKVYVKGVKLANMVKSGTYTFADNTMAASTDVTDFYVNYDESNVITLNSATAENADPAQTNIMKRLYPASTSAGRWYLIPQTVTSWKPEDDDTLNTANGTYLGLWVKITTQAGTKVYPAYKPWTQTNEWAWTAVPIPAELDFKQGKKYTVSINFFSKTGKGAGYQDPEEEGPDKPGHGKAAVGSTNKILFGATVDDWNDEVGVNIDL